MNKPILIALTNPVSADADAEFNRWYNEVHARDILSLPTVHSIARYRAIRQIRPHDGAPVHRYAAIYEMDDPARAVEKLIEMRPHFEMSPTLDTGSSVALTFEPIFSLRND